MAVSRGGHFLFKSSPLLWCVGGGNLFEETPPLMEGGASAAKSNFAQGFTLDCSKHATSYSPKINWIDQQSFISPETG